MEFVMVSMPEQFTAFGKAQFDTLLSFAGFAAASTEKLVEFQIKAAKAQIADVMSHARTLADAKDPQAATQAATAYLQPMADKAMNWSRDLYALSTETQAELGKLVEAQIGALNKQVTSLVDTATKSAPAGSEIAVSAVKSAMAAAGQAYDALTKAGKQVTEMTETAHATVMKNAMAANGAARRKSA
jgi:phasin family protein